MNLKSLSIPTLVLVALALQACGNGEAKVPEEEKAVPTIPVEVAAVRTGSVTAFYSTTATLEPAPSPSTRAANSRAAPRHTSAAGRS